MFENARKPLPVPPSDDKDKVERDKKDSDGATGQSPSVEEGEGDERQE